MSKQLLQPVTKKILGKVLKIISSSAHGALAVFEPDGEFPAVSKVSMALINKSAPVLLTSQLSPHTTALRANPYCSLMISQTGQGDPLAQPRITMFCRASIVASNQRSRIREGFLAQNPRAINYIDLPDFNFWQLEVKRASYIAGFGRAYKITGEQLFGADKTGETDHG